MTDEAILQVLRAREAQFVSGEELSRRAGVSRTAIWKGIEKLRSEGYKILAQSHVGYRLVGIPDRLTAVELQWQLQTKRIGKRIHAYERTDSTMDLAHQLAGSGEPEGTVVIAESQRKGRGRLGRVWTSPKGKGIYASFILRPQMSLKEAPMLTLMAAVAVARAMEGATGLRPEIKWPNDVMIHGKKLVGILTELSAELSRVNFVVIGIGMNVNSARSALPPEGTSLAVALGKKVDRVALAKRLFEEMDQIYADCLKNGFETVLEPWRGFAQFLGKHIRIGVDKGKPVDGQAVDIDPSGALLIRTDTGLVETVAAGDVVVVR